MTNPLSYIPLLSSFQHTLCAYHSSLVQHILCVGFQVNTEVETTVNAVYTLLGSLPGALASSWRRYYGSVFSSASAGSLELEGAWQRWRWSLQLLPSATAFFTHSAHFGKQIMFKVEHDSVFLSLQRVSISQEYACICVANHPSLLTYLWEELS